MISNQSAAVDVNSSGANTIVAAPGRNTQRIAVLGYVLANGAGSAQSAQFKSGSTNLSGAMSLPSTVGGSLAAQAGAETVGLFVTNPGDALTLTLTAATQVAGHVSYRYVQG
jgi:hypothetical protein